MRNKLLNSLKLIINLQLYDKNKAKYTCSKEVEDVLVIVVVVLEQLTDPLQGSHCHPICTVHQAGEEYWHNQRCRVCKMTHKATLDVRHIPIYIHYDQKVHEVEMLVTPVVQPLYCP